MGHVYRSFPLIQRLQLKGNIIHIACSEQQQAIFERYLKDVHFHYIKGYKFHFSNGKSFVMSNLFQLSDLFKQYVDDHTICERIVKKYEIDIVVSDHRYGFCSKKTESVFLTHQLQLPTKNRFLQKQHLRFINKNFKNAWILDNETHEFSGDLTGLKGIKINTEFIGPSSRFMNVEPLEKSLTVAIISGPEPFNKKLLESVSKYAKNKREKVYGITSLPFNEEFLLNVKPEMEDEIIRKAKVIISHCGYSTLMDLNYLQPEKALLIPTPKQTEQMYLSKLYSNEKYIILNDYKSLI